MTDSSFEMISGTNGIFGGVDGALILQQDPKNEEKATLEAKGRDIPTQKFDLIRNNKSCAWELVADHFSQLPCHIQPIIAKVSQFIGAHRLVWAGTASELKNILMLEENPNVITRWLNVGTSILLNEFHIYYSRLEKHGRKEISLAYLIPNRAEPQEPCTENISPQEGIYPDFQNETLEIPPPYYEFPPDPPAQSFDYTTPQGYTEQEEILVQDGMMDLSSLPPF